MVTSIEILQSQLRQQRENVRVWEEGLEREKTKLQMMKQALTEAVETGASDGVTADDGTN